MPTARRKPAYDPDRYRREVPFKMQEFKPHGKGIHHSLFPASMNLSKTEVEEGCCWYDENLPDDPVTRLPPTCGQPAEVRFGRRLYCLRHAYLIAIRIKKNSDNKVIAAIVWHGRKFHGAR